MVEEIFSLDSKCARAQSGFGDTEMRELLWSLTNLHFGSHWCSCYRAVLKRFVVGLSTMGKIKSHHYNIQNPTGCRYIDILPSSTFFFFTRSCSHLCKSLFNGTT